MANNFSSELLTCEKCKQCNMHVFMTPRLTTIQCAKCGVVVMKQGDDS